MDQLPAHFQIIKGFFKQFSKISKVFLICAPVIVISYLVIHYTPTTLAVGNLQDLRAVVNNKNVQAEDVEMDVTFRLPYTAEQISSTDYVIIDLSQFTDITNASSIDGSYSGTATYNIVGDEVQISGITVLPGTTITIQGITVTNPPIEGQDYVTVIIAEDSGGTIIKNIGTVITNSSNNTVSISATIDPPVSSLSISGYTAPGTFVTFTQNGSVIGTDSAGPTGFYSQVFTGLQPTTHSIRIYGVDQAARATTPVFMEIYTPIYTQTDVTDVILPPTIELSATQVAQGDNLTVFGSTVPDADFTLFTESPLRTYANTADSTGNWTYTITDTASYSPGDYRTYSIAQSGSLQSLASTGLAFSITVSGTITPTPAACDISQGDLSCDSSVNLTDFSILMFYWGTNQPAGDINSDGSVNLSDFSIMMFYWGT